MSELRLAHPPPRLTAGASPRPTGDQPPSRFTRASDESVPAPLRDDHPSILHSPPPPGSRVFGWCAVAATVVAWLVVAIQTATSLRNGFGQRPGAHDRRGRRGRCPRDHGCPQLLGGHLSGDPGRRSRPARHAPAGRSSGARCAFRRRRADNDGPRPVVCGGASRRPRHLVVGGPAGVPLLGCRAAPGRPAQSERSGRAHQAQPHSGADAPDPSRSGGACQAVRRRPGHRRGEGRRVRSCAGRDPERPTDRGTLSVCLGLADVNGGG